MESLNVGAPEVIWGAMAFVLSVAVPVSVIVGVVVLVRRSGRQHRRLADLEGRVARLEGRERPEGNT